MSPLKSCLLALIATGCVASAAAQPAEPAPIMPSEIDAIFEHRWPGKVAWTGDLSEMRGRRLIRVLVPNSRTFFFYDGLQPRGLAYEFMTEFVNTLNAGKSTNARVYALFLPTARDRLVADVVNGYGDVAIGGLTVTASREQAVDFISYDLTMSEIVVTAANASALHSLEELAGRKVFVRRSSSYYESLAALNSRLKAAGKSPVQFGCGNARSISVCPDSLYGRSVHNPAEQRVRTSVAIGYSA